MTRTFVKRFFFALFGILFGLTVAIEKIGILSFVSLIPAIFLFYQRLSEENYTSKKAYFDGLCFFYGYSFVCFSWFFSMSTVMIPVLGSFGALAVSLAGAFLLSFVEALLFSFTFLICYFFKKTVFAKKYEFLIALVFALLFSVFEYLKTFCFLFVPLVNVGMALTNVPALLGITSLFGTYFLSFVIILSNTFLAYAIYNRDKLKRFLIVGVSIILVSSMISIIVYLIPHESEGELNTMLIQENISSAEKWNESTFAEAFKRQKEMIEANEDKNLDLIITSETSLPTIFNYANFYKMAYKELAVEADADILLGTFALTDDLKSANAIMPIYKNGTIEYNFYAKKKLVPFGEYLPFGTVLKTIAPFLEDINLFNDEIVRGKDVSTLILSDNVVVGTVICFDSIYSDTTLSATKEGAEFFILSTNDSWFGSSNALSLHERQSRLRATECGRYMGIAGNTGKTEIISNKGEVKKSIPINEKNCLIGQIELYSYRTLYSYIGDTFSYVSIGILTFAFALDVFLKLKEKRKREDI